MTSDASASPYPLLNGIRVLEVAMLAPDSLGGILADMGADVIKFEAPPYGDYVRTLDSAVGSPDGPSLLHLLWNRGKRSVALDLRQPEAREIFLQMVGRSHVVIEGLRAGTLDRYDLGYETLAKVNPAIIFCTLSGLGRTGPYRSLATHGAFYDAYAGLLPQTPESTPDAPRAATDKLMSVGIRAAGLWAATGVLSALVRSLRTGTGALIDVAQSDAAALWRTWELEARLNEDKMQRRPNYGGGSRINESVRYNFYRTSDDRIIYFQATEDKFWRRFCAEVGRTDLLERFPSRGIYDHAAGNETLRQELGQIFRTRSQREWVELFLGASIPGGPVRDGDDFPIDDPHFEARENLYATSYPETGELRLTTTPVKIAGSRFRPGPVPSYGEHTDMVLHEVLGLDDKRIGELRQSGAIGVLQPPVSDP